MVKANKGNRNIPLPDQLYRYKGIIGATKYKARVTDGLYSTLEFFNALGELYTNKETAITDKKLYAYSAENVDTRRYREKLKGNIFINLQDIPERDFKEAREYLITNGIILEKGFNGKDNLNNEQTGKLYTKATANAFLKFNPEQSKIFSYILYHQISKSSKIIGVYTIVEGVTVFIKNTSNAFTYTEHAVAYRGLALSTVKENVGVIFNEGGYTQSRHTKYLNVVSDTIIKAKSINSLIHFEIDLSRNPTSPTSELVILSKGVYKGVSLDVFIGVGSLCILYGTEYIELLKNSGNSVTYQSMLDLLDRFELTYLRPLVLCQKQR